MVSIGSVDDSADDYQEFVARDDAAQDEGVGPFLEEWLQGGTQRSLDPRRYLEYLDLMAARLARCSELGFTRVALDAISAWEERVEFDLPIDDTLTYVDAVIEEAATLVTVQPGAEVA